MDFSFPPDSTMLRDMLRRFIEKEAQPLEMKYFIQGALEDKEKAHLRKLIDQMGLWGILVPEEYGGGGLDMVTACLLEEELGKTFFPLELGDVPPMLYACQGEQVEQYLEPALAGSRKAILAVREPHALRPEDWSTSAAAQGLIFVINGRKLISSKPGAEDFLIVIAKTRDENSSEEDDVKEGFSAFLLNTDHPGLSFSGKDRLILKLEECQVERGALLGKVGQAFKVGAEQAPRAWIRIGARFVGLADRLVSMATEYARDWVMLGAPLMNRPAVRSLLADISVQVNSARWLVYHAAWQADQGVQLHIPAAEVRLATGEMLKKVRDLVIMIYGGPGPSPEFDVQQAFFNLVPFEVLLSGAEGARNMIAAHLLKVGFFG